MKFVLQEFKIQLNITRIANLQYFEFSDFISEPDAHSFYELIYVDGGYLDIESENYSGRLKQNQMIIHPPDDRHRLFARADVSPHVIIIGFESKTDRLAPFQVPADITQAQQNVLAQVVREGRNVFLPPYDIPNQTNMEKRKEFSFGADQLIKNLLEYYLVLLIRQRAHEEQKSIMPATETDDPLISDICGYINNNLTHKFTIRELCLLYGINKTTLSKLFKNQTNLTIMDYIQKAKINRAKDMLKSGKFSVTEIADKLNFSCIHYFSKTFKKLENISPTEYIKQNL